MENILNNKLMPLIIIVITIALTSLLSMLPYEWPATVVGILGFVAFVGWIVANVFMKKQEKKKPTTRLKEG